MGRAPCCDKANVKRGPWSPEEDALLRDYMDRSGSCANWIALPHKAGLKRCGKSCRLRWLNYLRPNIKHGEFSDEEDRVICTLYATIGSRWSIIAGQLPGRTDNDIKNYWNTKLKKKLMGMITTPQQQWKPLPPLPPPPPSSDLSLYHNFITNPSSLLSSQFDLPPLMNLNYSSGSTTPPDYTYNKSPYFLSETNTSLTNTSLQLQDDSFSFLGFGNDDQVMTMMNGSCSSGDGSSIREVKEEADQTVIMFQDQGSSSSYYTNSNIIATSAAFGNNYNNVSDDEKLLNVKATDRDEAARHGHGDDHALLEDVKRLVCSHDLTQEKKKTHQDKNMHYFW